MVAHEPGVERRSDLGETGRPRHIEPRGQAAAGRIELGHEARVAASATPLRFRVQ